MIWTVRDAQVALAPVFEQYGVSRAVLFGSIAQGTATQESDIDLLVDSHLRGMKFVGLMEAIRQVTERPVDVFDVTHIERGSPLDWEIHATGIDNFRERNMNQGMKDGLPLGGPSRFHTFAG